MVFSCQIEIILKTVIELVWWHHHLAIQVFFLFVLVDPLVQNLKNNIADITHTVLGHRQLTSVYCANLLCTLILYHQEMAVLTMKGGSPVHLPYHTPVTLKCIYETHGVIFFSSVWTSATFSRPCFVSYSRHGKSVEEWAGFFLLDKEHCRNTWTLDTD